MGIILPFPATRPSRRMMAEALGEETLGAILFFTGVRYERHGEAGMMEPNNGPHTGSKRTGRGAGRKSRKKH